MFYGCTIRGHTIIIFLYSLGVLYLLRRIDHTLREIKDILTNREDNGQQSQVNLDEFVDCSQQLETGDSTSLYHQLVNNPAGESPQQRNSDDALSLYHQLVNNPSPTAAEEVREHVMHYMSLDNPPSIVHKLNLISMGIIIRTKPFYDQLLYCNQYREIILMTIHVLPDDVLCNQIYGRWMFEMAQLSWWQKGVVRRLVSSDFNYTYSDTLDQFLKTDKLAGNCGDAVSRVFIAKCFCELGDAERSRNYVTSISRDDLESMTKHDRAVMTIYDNLISK